MDAVRHRTRGEPVHLGAVDTAGGTVGFFMPDHGRIAFSTAETSPLLQFGVRVHAAGTIRFGWGLDLSPRERDRDMDVALKHAPGHNGIDAAFIDGDRDRALSEAVTRNVREAAAAFVAANRQTVADAWMTLADDYALSRMSYRAHCVEGYRRASDAGEGWDAVTRWKDQIDAAEREAASVDEEAYANAWMHSTRPGYVVSVDGMPADRGDVRHPDDRGDGWLQRHVFVHMSQAFRFAAGLAGGNVRVDRVRIVEGRPFAVVPEGLAAPSWNPETPMLTGTVIAP